MLPLPMRKIADLINEHPERLGRLFKFFTLGEELSCTKRECVRAITPAISPVTISRVLSVVEGGYAKGIVPATKGKMIGMVTEQANYEIDFELASQKVLLGIEEPSETLYKENKDNVGIEVESPTVGSSPTPHPKIK